MRITNPRHTPLLTLSSSGVCLCKSVFECVRGGDMKHASDVCPKPSQRRKQVLKGHICVKGGHE